MSTTSARTWESVGYSQYDTAWNGRCQGVYLRHQPREREAEPLRTDLDYRLQKLGKHFVVRHHCGFWLVCAGAVAVAVVATRVGTQSRMLLNFSELAVPFFSLGQMLTTTMMTQQERSDRVEELIEALPYRVSTWLLGQFLVAYLLWLTVSAGLWVLGGLMVVAAGAIRWIRACWP